jgi:hypothetical protein
VCYSVAIGFPMRLILAHAGLRKRGHGVLQGCPAGGGILRLLAGCAALVLGAAAAASAQDGGRLRVVPLVRAELEQVLVSFEFANGITEAVRAAIHSGLKTTFTYTVELRLDVPGWVDRTIGTATVTTTVEYDNLTRRHNVVRLIDGRVEQALVTEDETVVRRWLTTADRLPLFRTTQLEPNRQYYVRVSASSRPSTGSILWPFSGGPSAQAKFTFIR